LRRCIVHLAAALLLVGGVARAQDENAPSDDDPDAQAEVEKSAA